MRLSRKSRGKTRTLHACVWCVLCDLMNMCMMVCMPCCMCVVKCWCNTPKDTLVVFNMFRVFCRHKLKFFVN